MTTVDGERLNNPPPRVRRTLLGLVIAATALLPAPAGANAAAHPASGHPGPIKVMPLGDSLTEGYNIPGGYRIELVDLLADGELDVDLVGSLSNGPATLSDREHEGHSGFRIDQISESIVDWLEAERPDIVLLMLGTNDVVQDFRRGTAPARLGALIDTITSTLPDGHVIVASIPQIVGSPYAEGVEAYNADLPDVVRSRIDDGLAVSFVDINSVVEVTDLHTDYTHLNATGYCKLAHAWYAAVESVLAHPSEGSAAATSTPDSTSPDSTCMAGRQAP